MTAKSFSIRTFPVGKPSVSANSARSRAPVLLPERLRGGDGVKAAFYFGGDLGFEIDAFPIAGGGGELFGEFFADFFLDGGVKSERSAGGDAVVVGHSVAIRGLCRTIR